MNFSFFSSLIIRTPAYSIDFYKNLTKELSIEPDVIKELVKDSQINEALYFASPELYSEIQKWCKQEDYAIYKSEKIKLSVLKYLIRMSTRCTPFGLFAACGSGNIGDVTKISVDSNSVDKENCFYRKTRLDMQFVANLYSKLAADLTIQDQLLFYPNSTLYQLGDFYRYVEYTLENNNRKYSLEALKRTDYLDLIVQKASNGISKEELADYLMIEDITKNEALEFIEELISNQILVSELEPKLTGNTSVNDLISGAKKESEAAIKFETLINEVEKQLQDIDTKLGNDISYYTDIEESLSKTKISFDKKYLFQADLFLESKGFELEKKYTSELYNAIKFLNKISERPKNTPLENFKKAFIERYEYEMIPLVKALDIETGIGYLQNNNSDSTPLLDCIEIKQKTNSENHQISLNKVDKIIYNKLQNALQNGKTSIALEYSDFKNEDFSTENMPNTFSSVFEIVEEAGKEWIVIQSIGGSSAANLLARFCYGNEGVNSLANEITQFESESFANKIIAEIIHLPESRTGNILRRPSFRTYEIPYLGQSNVQLSNQINIEDLMVFVKKGRLILWSEKHNKEVITRLTNAHNYSYKALPIYQFLCDMQFENCKSVIGFNNKFEKFFDYLPRVTVGNCIISKAKWIFNKNRCPDFFKIVNDKTNSTPDLVRSAILSMNIKGFQYLSLIDGDNTLVINLENDTCIEMLVETVKNKTQFILEEFLFPSGKVVKGEMGSYANQFIVGIKNKT
ncbi:lantibiotic dehydratase family protein [Flavobacterium sp. PS2]|uniref:lantibiotic dehydratase family protein n=1 Tax=Flavobacterium sp. PS2 TaxID=3384157 RepID=UPI00390CDA96